jgi:diacylglycerol kinase
MAKPFSLSARLESFAHAFRGLGLLLVTQHNARIHLLISVLVVSAGVAAGLSRWEWVAIVLAIGMVWGGEALNTAIEQLADALQPEFHPGIRRAKDVAAAAVLISAVAAGTIGLLVFVPHLALLLRP